MLISVYDAQQPNENVDALLIYIIGMTFLMIELISLVSMCLKFFMTIAYDCGAGS
jgi:hypothetical protein